MGSIFCAGAYTAAIMPYTKEQPGSPAYKSDFGG